jgi:hypothetical protein
VGRQLVMFTDPTLATLEPGSGIVDSRTPIVWLDFVFEPRGRAGESFSWWCLELASTIVRQENATWVCRGIAGGPSDSGDSAHLALERATEGLIKQQKLAARVLDQIASRV